MFHSLRRRHPDRRSLVTAALCLVAFACEQPPPDATDSRDASGGAAGAPDEGGGGGGLGIGGESGAPSVGSGGRATTGGGGEAEEGSGGGAPQAGGAGSETDGTDSGAGGSGGKTGGQAGTGGEGSDGGTNSGGSGSDAGSGGTHGSGGSVDPGPVNGCDAFLDRTADEASRIVHWGYGIATAPERCLRIHVGQTVTFEGVFGTHPLGNGGGDQPNPIVGNYEVGDTAYAVMFEASGTFGFECLTHSTMRGAVDVVP